LPNIVIKASSGNEVFIELPDAKSYGELPWLPLFSLKK